MWYVCKLITRTRYARCPCHAYTLESVRLTVLFSKGEGKANLLNNIVRFGNLCHFKDQCDSRLEVSLCQCTARFHHGGSWGIGSGAHPASMPPRHRTQCIRLPRTPSNNIYAIFYVIKGGDAACLRRLKGHLEAISSRVVNMARMRA
jgi:hypothetical protein